jgi:hypothetical protein
MRKIYLGFILFVFILSAVISCQKDENVKTEPPAKVSVADTSQTEVSMTGSVLAVKGELKITVEDSTYIFDASRDSIAFVNLSTDDAHYYGLTAINKEHTVSFGISSGGFPTITLPGNIAGGQFIISRPDKENLQYTLSAEGSTNSFGTLHIDAYRRDSTLAKGSFQTFMSKDIKDSSSISRIEGEFDLQLK